MHFTDRIRLNLWRIRWGMDIPVSHKKKRELVSGKPYVYTCVTYRLINPDVTFKTISGEERQTTFIDNYCVTCGKLIDYSTRRIYRKNSAECFACVSQRWDDEFIEIWFLIKELPWLVENAQFSQDLFGIYLDLSRYRLIINDDPYGIYNPTAEYHHILGLVPAFPYPHWNTNGKCWMIFQRESLEYHPLSRVLDKRPITSERERVFQEGMRLLCLEGNPYLLNK